MPAMSPGALEEARLPTPRWWVLHHMLGGEWEPIALTLDRLYEVEERLTADSGSATSTASQRRSSGDSGSFTGFAHPHYCTPGLKKRSGRWLQLSSKSPCGQLVKWSRP
jgi:hypothetical protein